MTFTIDGEEFDEVILAGQPDRPQDYDDERKVRWNKAVEWATAQGEPFGRYEGSVNLPCMVCGIDTRIGPRQQTVMAAVDKPFIACVVDAPLAAHALEEQRGDASVSVKSLGNEYKETP